MRCRGVYHGQDTSSIQPDQFDVVDGGRRSKRPRMAADVNHPLASAIMPLQCFRPDGKTIPMHHCDIVFMTYESLRKELGYQQKCAQLPSQGLLRWTSFGQNSM